MAEEIRALLEENRRLRKEVRQLRKRMDAFERSRWWRAHPRFLLRRPASDGSGDRADDPPAEPLSSRVPDADIAVRFRREILEVGTFSRDTVTSRLTELDPIVLGLANSEADILEIGSFEGLSASYFLWRLPDAQLTCVDTFRGSVGSDAELYGPGLVARFEQNVALVDRSRVRMIVGDSRRVLLDLIDEGPPEFDLIYVDGSHLGLDVLVDAALSWRLLRPGGTMVFDDYLWNDRGDDPLLRPGPAIDAVLGLLEGKVALLAKGSQVPVRKL